MAKNGEQRRGFLARWYRRLRWPRRLLVLGGLAAGVAKLLRRRSRGTAAGSPGAAAQSQGPAPRRVPIGGPLSQRRAAAERSAHADDEVAVAASAAPNSVRTLVSVPPLRDADESSGDVPEAGTRVAAFAPLAAVGEPEVADDDAASGSDDEDDAAGGPAPVLTVVEGSGNETTASSGDRTWVEPLADGGCPPGYPVKANDNSGICHVPGGRSYNRTVADRCYSSAEAAEADGYRAAKA